MLNIFENFRDFCKKKCTKIAKKKDLIEMNVKKKSPYRPNLHDKGPNYLGQIQKFLKI